jgi:hypothetical protein
VEMLCLDGSALRKLLSEVGVFYVRFGGRLWISGVYRPAYRRKVSAVL